MFEQPEQITLRRDAQLAIKIAAMDLAGLRRDIQHQRSRAIRMPLQDQRGDLCLRRVTAMEWPSMASARISSERGGTVATASFDGTGDTREQCSTRSSSRSGAK